MNRPDRSRASKLRSAILRTLPWASIFLVATCLPTGIGPIFVTFSIPTTSMMPGLKVGDQIIVSRIAYGYSRHSFSLFHVPMEGRWPSLSLPKRGDIVVFKWPENAEILDVKRIVGLPGDRIQIARGVLTINGQTVKIEEAGEIPSQTACGPTRIPLYHETLPGGPSYLIEKLPGICTKHGWVANDNAEYYYNVPPGQYFMFGDNRDNSADSRFFAMQFVPLDKIVGPVVTSFSGALLKGLVTP